MIPVKLTRNEITIPPQVAQMNRARLEEMNRQGLLARNAGGVVAYKNQGGPVDYSMDSQGDPNADLVVRLVNELGIPGTDHGFFVASDAVASYLAMSAEEQKAVGSLAEYVKYAWTEASDTGTGEPATAADLYEGDYQVPAGGLNPDPRTFKRGGLVSYYQDGTDELGVQPAAPVNSLVDVPAAPVAQADTSAIPQESAKTSDERSRKLILDLAKRITPAWSEDDVLNLLQNNAISLKQNEAQSVGFAMRMSKAVAKMRKAAVKGFNPSALRDASDAGDLGLLPDITIGSVPIGDLLESVIGWVPNILRKEQSQVFDSAKRDFINAALREESGAQIAASEFANAEAQYLPVLGDGIDAMAAKSESMMAKLDGMAVSAGVAAPLMQAYVQRALHGTVPMWQTIDKSESGGGLRTGAVATMSIAGAWGAGKLPLPHPVLKALAPIVGAVGGAAFGSMVGQALDDIYYDREVKIDWPAVFDDAIISGIIAGKLKVADKLMTIAKNGDLLKLFRAARQGKETKVKKEMQALGTGYSFNKGGLVKL